MPQATSGDAIIAAVILPIPLTSAQSLMVVPMTGKWGGWYRQTRSLCVTVMSAEPGSMQ